jgi:hypothetical protein
MGRLRKFWSLGPRERGYLLEATVLLIITHVCLRAVAFRHIERFLRTWRQQRGSELRSHAEEISLVQLSVSRAVRGLRWENHCLRSSIAAYVMLRRRGVPATIVAGVRASEDSSLHAHAWLHPQDISSGKVLEHPGYPALLRIGPESGDA